MAKSEVTMAGRLGTASTSGKRRQKEELGWLNPPEAPSPLGADVRACGGEGHAFLLFDSFMSPVVQL